MNYIKAIFLTILIVLGIGVSPAVSQTATFPLYQYWGNGGMWYTLSTGNSKLDTAAKATLGETTSDTGIVGCYYTGWFDATTFDNSTVYMMGSYVAPLVSAGADTCIVIIEGTYTGNNGGGWYQGSSTSAFEGGLVDTVYVLSSVGWKNFRSNTGTTYTLTPSSYYPMWRLRYRSCTDGTRGWLRLALYATANDAVPTYKRWGEH